VAEVIKDGVNGRLVDFFDVKGWSAALTDALARPEGFDGMREAARRMVRDRYDLKTRLPAKAGRASDPAILRISSKKSRAEGSAGICPQIAEECCALALS
jgi:hypothetical protein